MATTSVARTRNSRTTIYPLLYTIQYPNCPRGMFSLRPPFKDLYELPSIDPKRTTTTTTTKEAPGQPIYGNISTRPRSKRNASIQCSLLLPDVRREVAVQANVKSEIPTDERYRSRRRLASSESNEKIYELWEVESTETPEFVSIDSQRLQRRRRGKLAKPTAVVTDDDDDDDDDDDVDSNDDQEHIIYARHPRKPRKKTYLPSNVRMMCVRDEPKRTFH